MVRLTRTLVATGLFVTALAAAPALFAHESTDGAGDEMGRDMMGGSGMMGMMRMMGEMSEMMKTCNDMMQGMTNHHSTQPPNEQWRGKSPDSPESKQ